MHFIQYFESILPISRKYYQLGCKKLVQSLTEPLSTLKTKCFRKDFLRYNIDPNESHTTKFSLEIMPSWRYTIRQ